MAHATRLARLGQAIEARGCQSGLGAPAFFAFSRGFLGLFLPFVLWLLGFLCLVRVFFFWRWLLCFVFSSVGSCVWLLCSVVCLCVLSFWGGCLSLRVFSGWTAGACPCKHNLLT